MLFNGRDSWEITVDIRNKQQNSCFDVICEDYSLVEL
jgi:hypothetical protein